MRSQVRVSVRVREGLGALALVMSLGCAASSSPPGGTMLREDILRGINAGIWVHSACKRARPDISGGKVVVDFVIDLDGTVSRADVRSATVEDSAFIACILDATRALRFATPPVGGTVTVTFPFAFRP